MNERRIETQVTLTPAEMYRGSLSVQLGKVGVPRAILFVLSVFFLGAMISVSLSKSDDEVLRQIAPLLGWVLFPVGICGSIAAAPYFAMRSQLRRNPRTLGPADYSFSEAGIKVAASLGQAEVQWAGFVQIRETNEMLLFYVMPRLAYVVPKRCFSSKAEIVELRDLMRKSYSGKLDIHTA